MGPTETKILLSLAAVGGFALIVFISTVVLRIRDAVRGRRLRARLVQLEEVAAFAKPGCILCHKSGTLQRRPHPSAPAMSIPCGCASRRFLAKHGGAIEQIGGQVFWKRHALNRNARRLIGGALARAA